jgi:hypothetical protein
MKFSSYFSFNFVPLLSLLMSIVVFTSIIPTRVRMVFPLYTKNTICLTRHSCRDVAVSSITGKDKRYVLLRWFCFPSTQQKRNVFLRVKKSISHKHCTKRMEERYVYRLILLLKMILFMQTLCHTFTSNSTITYFTVRFLTSIARRSFGWIPMRIFRPL